MYICSACLKFVICKRDRNFSKTEHIPVFFSVSEDERFSSGQSNQEDKHWDLKQTVRIYLVSLIRINLNLPIFLGSF